MAVIVMVIVIVEISLFGLRGFSFLGQNLYIPKNIFFGGEEMKNEK